MHVQESMFALLNRDHKQAHPEYESGYEQEQEQDPDQYVHDYAREHEQLIEQLVTSIMPRTKQGAAAEADIRDISETLVLKHFIKITLDLEYDPSLLIEEVSIMYPEFFEPEPELELDFSPCANPFTEAESISILEQEL